MKQEVFESASTYSIGGGAYVMARVIEHKDALDAVAQISHDITMIIAGVLLVGRVLYDGIRCIRWIYRYFRK